MSGKYEVVGNNKVKITFIIENDKFEEGINQAYKRNRGKINIPGFRKGKAPRKIIELNFGKDIFFEDAINIVLPEIYEATVSELKLDVVSRPEIDIAEISEEEGVTITAEVYTKPEIEIPADVYKNAEYTPVESVVTDEEINGEFDKAREQNSRMVSVERPVEDGDIVTIDFEGFIDGEAFPGGKGENYELTIGSGSFIDNFEQQLIGTKLADDLEVNVSFPAEYHAEELAGKPAMFKVEIKDIRKKEMPELDDEFAQEVSEFDTLEEYKNSIKEKLSEAKLEDAERKKEDDIISYIISKIEMDIPEVMIENQVEQMVNDFANQIRMQGLPLETYLQYVGQDMDSLRAAYAEGAEKQVKGRLVLEAVAKAEDFAITDEERDVEIARISESYGMEVDRLKEILRQEDKEGLDTDLKVKKAVDFIKANAKAI